MTRASIDALLKSGRIIQTFVDLHPGTNSGLTPRRTINKKKLIIVLYPPKVRGLRSHHRRSCHLNLNVHRLSYLVWSPLVPAALHTEINRLDLRGSETSTLVSNKECGTGIATEGVDFIALLTLGRNFSVSQSSFGWSILQSALSFKKRYIPELKNYDREKGVDGRTLLSIPLRSKKSNVPAAIGLLRAVGLSAGSGSAEHANQA